MIFLKFFLLFLFLNFFSFFKFHKLSFGDLKQKSQVEEYALCEKKNSKDVRTIRVNIFQPTGADDRKCETIYTKKGKDEIIGSGKYEGTCYQFLRNIKENLEKANWTCKDISKAQIFHL